MGTGPRAAACFDHPYARPKLLIKHPSTKAGRLRQRSFLLFRQRSLEPSMIINILDVGVMSHPRAFPCRPHQGHARSFVTFLIRLEIVVARSGGFRGGLVNMSLLFAHKSVQFNSIALFQTQQYSMHTSST